MKNNNAWLLFVASRFGSVDRKGRSAATNLLSSLGIAFGVTALIVILAVMNGFQQGYIKSILETSSYHARLNLPSGAVEQVLGMDGVRAAVPFRDIQTLILGNFSRQSGCVLRALPPDTEARDPAFAAETSMVSGAFDLDDDHSIVLGYELAWALRSKVGDTVSLVAVAGGADADLFPADADMTVRGIFKTGYGPIDAGYAYVSTDAGIRLSGELDTRVIGVKLENPDNDSRFLREAERAFPQSAPESWRVFNRAYFGALKIEKNMLMFLVILIFAVVAVNIFHGMRRSVLERKEEIAVLSALGARPLSIRLVFLLNGLGTGLAGSFLGLIAGLFISVHINGVFSLAEQAVNFANLIAAAVAGTDPKTDFALFSPQYFYMDFIPIRIFLSETVAVFTFGILSAAGAAWFASGSVLRMKPAEVMRYE